MKNTKLFILVGLASFCSVNAVRDINLRTHNANKPINKLDASGNNELHKAALNCQNIDETAEKKNMAALAQKYGHEFLADLNPYTPNKEGKTPKKISEEIFEKTGSLNCKYVAYNFALLEEELMKGLRK